MDPLSQGVIGVVAAQTTAATMSNIQQRLDEKKSHLAAATFIGIISGMAPDLDIFIRSAVDPLFSLEYHRHFTHSLFFIPIGALLCTLFVYALLGWSRWFKNRGITFKTIYFYSIAAYATHGLLDACTTYGTQLLWPFTDARIAWNIISIIDPLFTIPLLLLITIAAISKKKWFTYSAIIWMTCYFSFGLIQRERAEAAGYELAKSRGHELNKNNPSSLRATPSFANLLVWKIIYRHDNYFYVDAVKIGVGFDRKTHIFEGERIEELDLERDFSWLDKNSQQAKDVERFRWFSSNYLARSPYYPNRIIDMRYSLRPNQVRALWGIELDPNKKSDEHVRYVVNRGERNKALANLWEMIRTD